jgi:nicotinamidase-related amidase
MSLNDLSARAVVLLIDEIEGIAEMGRTASAKSVDKAAAALANAANIFGIPIVVSGIAFPDPPKLTSALRAAVGKAAQIHVRQTTDSFDDPAIRGAIEATGRKTVLIAGIVTEIAVQRAAFGGKERGYETQVVLDACNGVSERTEEAAIHRMSDAGVVLTSVPAVVGEMAIDFADPRTQKLFGLLQEL